MNTTIIKLDTILFLIIVFIWTLCVLFWGGKTNIYNGLSILIGVFILIYYSLDHGMKLKEFIIENKIYYINKKQCPICGNHAQYMKNWNDTYNYEFLQCINCKKIFRTIERRPI